eukprot:1246816-Rhodomonas_salina.1
MRQHQTPQRKRAACCKVGYSELVEEGERRFVKQLRQPGSSTATSAPHNGQRRMRSSRTRASTGNCKAKA